MFSKFNPLFFGLILISVFFISGCAGPRGFWLNSLPVPGFFGGVVQGILMPLLSIPWLFAKLLLWIFGIFNFQYGTFSSWLDTFQLYTTTHDDGYWEGYLLGILLYFRAHTYIEYKVR